MAGRAGGFNYRKDVLLFMNNMQLIKHLDFVEVEKVKKKKPNARYDFFNSAGLWANREIDAKELRKQAWSR